MQQDLVKNGHQKDACYNEIDLCAQNIDNTPSSTVNTRGGPM